MGTKATIEKHDANPLLSRAKSLLRSYGLRARKGLGQHFLVDKETLGRVVAAAELTNSDIILEVGSGLGVLTRELVKKAGWVLAIELDDKLAAILEDTLKSFGNVSVVNKSILEVDLTSLLQENKAKFPSSVNTTCCYKMVANLPYYITFPVLRYFLEASLKPHTMVVMVQKEVAESIVAGPGQMSMLSISVQFYGEPEIISYVQAKAFYPVPEVDSAILRIKTYAQPRLDVGDINGFFDLVRAGFTASRKQIANSLVQGLKLPKADILSLLKKAEITPQRRAEALMLDEWARLWQIFTEVGK